MPCSHWGIGCGHVCLQLCDDFAEHLQAVVHFMRVRVRGLSPRWGWHKRRRVDGQSRRGSVGCA